MPNLARPMSIPSARSRRTTRTVIRAAAAALTAASFTSIASAAGLTFNVEPTGWDSDARRNAAIAALTAITNRYNAYGDFGGYNIYAYYNSGIPTAQAGYGGWGGSIGYGGTYPNDRVTLHESNHYLGSGTYAHTYDGPKAIAIMEQFEGVGARFGTDGTHFWPYGMNYDNEWSEVAAQRNIAIMYALRQDWGIGSAANPTAWAATSVTLTGNDARGESGFNFGSKWSDGTFAHPNADYSTGALAMRTPAGNPDWTFAGKSLTVNAGGSLLYNSWGTTGTITIRNLTLNNGTLRHDQNPQDTFRLAGNITVTGSAKIDANRGPITISAPITGTGSINKNGPYPLTLTNANSYAGDTNINAGTLRLTALSPVASYTFDSVSGTTVYNTGSGGSAMNGTLANGAAVVAGGQSGNAVSLAGAASVDINNGIADLGPSGYWTVSAWVKTATPGASLLTKGDGSGWSNGNTIFYLGDGTAGGSGGIPSAVRWGGGFFQGSTSAANVANNTWHQVTYVNNGGNYAIYADGNPQPLSTGNSSFSNADVGSVVRLGVSTNTFAGDGTANFNGLLDNVHFYNQSLSAAQVAALYQGNTTFSPLTTSSNVTVAFGAVLDVNNVTQQIGSLAGSAGSAVTLGSGRLTVNSSASTTFAGAISGNGGALVKSGSGTLTLGAANTYTGSTTISQGVLRLSSTPVSAVHRWSFNNSLADSAGNSTASIVDVGANNATLSATRVTLAGGASNASDYVSLGSGLVPKSNTPVTIELWATQNALQNWSRIFDLGTGTGENLFMSWTQGTNLASDRVEWKDAATNTVDNSAQPYIVGTEYHIAMVLNPVGSSTQVTWYAAPAAAGSIGAAKGSFTSANTLADFFDSADSLGYSSYAGDDTASASYNEVRFWSGALSAATLQTLHTAGPDANLSAISQPLSTGQLPTTTALNITSAGAALDLNGINQTVASLTGAEGSSVLLGGATLTVSGSSSTSFAGAISGPGGLTKSGPAILTLTGPNSYTGTTTVSGGTLALGSSFTSSAVLVIADGAMAQLTAGGDRVLKFGTLDLNASGIMDLSDGMLVLTAATPATLVGYLRRGYNDGTWTGSGLTSSTAAADTDHTTAIGWAKAADLGVSTWGEVPVGLADLLTRYTYYGDLNLDGVVNGDDYALMDRGFAKGLTGWVNGDVNYDGAVTSADYLLADTAYANQHGMFLSPAFLAARESQFGTAYVNQLVASVPEPSVAGGLLLAVTAVLGHRRRRT